MKIDEIKLKHRPYTIIFKHLLILVTIAFSVEWVFEKFAPDINHVLLQVIILILGFIYMAIIGERLLKIDFSKWRLAEYATRLKQKYYSEN